MLIFGKGKCKFIANFSARMVTSLPSHYFRLTLSLSHRLYLTHNIGSASALPIIQRENANFSATTVTSFPSFSLSLCISLSLSLTECTSRTIYHFSAIQNVKSFRTYFLFRIKKNAQKGSANYKTMNPQPVP